MNGGTEWKRKGSTATLWGTKGGGHYYKVGAQRGVLVFLCVFLKQLGRKVCFCLNFYMEPENVHVLGGIKMFALSPSLF